MDRPNILTNYKARWRPLGSSLSISTSSR